MDRLHEWLWWAVGMGLWKRSARLLPQTEVKRRLGWMTLDCRENNIKWRASHEGILWLASQAEQSEKGVRDETRI